MVAKRDGTGRGMAKGSVVLAGALLSLAQAAHAAGSACPNPAFAQAAQAAIAAHEQANTFSGAVLVAIDGQPVLRRGVGLADRERGVAVTPEMNFRVGSITKQFTSAAILQLQEAGKLSIDDPIGKYYRDAPPAWAKITLRHLLTHTSGIPSYTDIPGFFAREARLPHTPEELIKLTRDKPLQFEPGSRFAYDNSGYILLGYVVEKVSGERYADYVQKHLFGPLGMTGSGYDDTGRIIPGRAAGYDRGPGGTWRNATFLDMSVPYAAGSLYSTVDDLLKWDQALYAERLLKPQSLKTMFADYGHHYGLGFFIDRKWGQDRIQHGGDINGFSASFQRYPAARVTAVALANLATPAAEKLASDLAGLCLGADVRSAAAEAGRLARAPAAERRAPSPGSEEALRRVIGELQRGEPDYSRMGPRLADAVRAQADATKATLAALGTLKSLKFQSVGPGGADIYTAVFENGALELRIALGDAGRVDTLFLRPAP